MSKNYERFKGKYLNSRPRMNASVLDIRFKDVRDFLVDTYVSYVTKYGWDGLKLDFIDSFVLKGKSLEYDKNRDFYCTTSPSMDILISSNLERLLYILCGRSDETINDWFGKLKSEGKYTVTDDVKALIGDMFFAGCCDDKATAGTINATFNDYGYLADTHTAVAINVCNDYIAKTGDVTPVVVASTASPFKFSKAVLGAVEAGAADYDDEFATVDALEKLASLKAPEQLSALKGKQVRFTQVTAKEDMAEVVFNMLGI